MTTSQLWRALLALIIFAPLGIVIPLVVWPACAANRKRPLLHNSGINGWYIPYFIFGLQVSKTTKIPERYNSLTIVLCSFHIPPGISNTRGWALYPELAFSLPYTAVKSYRQRVDEAIFLSPGLYVCLHAFLIFISFFFFSPLPVVYLYASLQAPA